MAEDHTPGDTGGRMFLVNAEAAAGEFFSTTVNGLCSNTTYEFSAWLINLVQAGTFCSGQPGGTIPVNVSFEIWDGTGNTTLLASGNTGNIVETGAPNWEQYGLVFQTLTGQNTVVLKMINSGQGGCGNDLAIDDIEFTTCGDNIAVTDVNNNTAVNICSGETPYTLALTATPDNIVFNSHFYQWQESADGNTWVDIAGASNQNVTVTNITASTYYRARIAEVAINLANPQCITLSDNYQINVTAGAPAPIIECWETATLNPATCQWVVTGNQPPEPTGLECWETAIFNNTTCAWEVTGAQPTPPTGLECWETAIFNNATCVWDVTGTQPVPPTGLECWETAIFNNATCVWDVAGAQPPQPAIECWETTIFNNATCAWEVTGVQPTPPTGLECWETAIFNNATCAWEVTGAQPTPPTGLECWETAIFNNATCVWDVTGTQPVPPTGLECWETAIFNNAICAWEVTGAQPPQPAIECWETAIFNNVTCAWEINGVQPIQPAIECWETSIFNNTTCAWEVTGAQPTSPTGLECWETAIFNNVTCAWEINGVQPIQPTIECWETAIFNNTTCAWEVTGAQPTPPTGLECWETAIFNNTLCIWEVSGVEPAPIVTNANICEGGAYTWAANGITYTTTQEGLTIPGINCGGDQVLNLTVTNQPSPPTIACYEVATYNPGTCSWEITGTQPEAPTGLACWENASFNDTTCTWDINGNPPEPTVTNFTICQGASYTWPANNVTYTTEQIGLTITGVNCEGDQILNLTITEQPEQPIIACYETAIFNIDTCTWEITGTRPEEPITAACWETTTFNNDLCLWEIIGEQPEQPFLECYETAMFNTSTCNWDISGTPIETLSVKSLTICDNNVLTLQPQTNILNPNYTWSTDEITENIIVTVPGTYTVTITDEGCSFEQITFTVVNSETPIIESIISNGTSIIVNTINSGDFLYSLDGMNFQIDNEFSRVDGGLYTIYVKNQNCDTTVNEEHLHFNIPKFFTPNNDGINDTFKLSGIENYGSSQIAIFNRYGKLLVSVNDTSFEWDGTYKNEIMPSDDYWYAITIENQRYTGHFALKR